MKTQLGWMMAAVIALSLSVAGYGCGGEDDEEVGEREVAAKSGSGSQGSGSQTGSQAGSQTGSQGSGSQTGTGTGSQSGPPAAQPTCTCPTGFAVCACPATQSSQGPQGGPQSGMQGANAQAANAGGSQADGDVCCCCANQP